MDFKLIILSRVIYNARTTKAKLHIARRVKKTKKTKLLPYEGVD